MERKRPITAFTIKRMIAVMLAAAICLGCVSCARGPEGAPMIVDVRDAPAATVSETAPAPTDTPTPTPEPTPTPAPTPVPTPTPEPVSITMMFVGDLMCLAAQQYCALAQSESGREYDFNPSFKYVRPLLSGADCAIGNLETVLSPSAPYSTQAKEIGGKPNCNGPAKYLDAVKYAGFDAIVLANNHCCDAGVKGINETLDAVERYGIPHTGLFRTADEDRFIILDVKGIKVGLLSYSELYNGKEGCVSGCPYMINTYSASAIKRDVAAAKAAGAELIVAYNHWGTEHVHKPTDDVRRHAKQMADAGVDIICGSHSHSMQPIVWLTASDGRRVLCMYSLGNFVSSMARETANDTVIVEVRITRESSGRVLVANEICHPCRVFPQLQGKYFVVVPTDNTSIPSIKSRLKEAEKRIMDIITSEQG